jgi:hypothetical protein
MEDTLGTYMTDHFVSALGPEQNAYSMPEQYSTYPEPDGNSSYPNSNGMSYMGSLPEQFQNQFNQNIDLPHSSHDELNQFFTGSPFGNRSPALANDGLTSYTQFGASQGGYMAPTSHGQYAQYMDSSSMSGYDVLPEQGNPLAIMTKNLVREASTKTTVQHGQITPGDSPASPTKSGDDGKTAKKQKTIKKENSKEIKGAASDAVPVKKTRKPRKSHKKIPTPEQEAEKREQFLKRNREAAHKCRIKKKNQTENIQETAKELAHENAKKGLELEKLKLEIETLRALLLPHYRECGDMSLIEYMDSATSRYELWAKERLEADDEARRAQSRRSGSAESSNGHFDDNDTNASSPDGMDDDDEDVKPGSLSLNQNSPLTIGINHSPSRRNSHYSDQDAL